VKSNIINIKNICPGKNEEYFDGDTGFVSPSLKGISAV